MVAVPAAAPVAVVGMAWTTALGRDLGAVWERLLAGETGFVEVPSPHRLRNLLAAVVEPLGDDAATRLRSMTAETVRRALGHARLTPNGALLVLGTSLGAFLDDARERESALGAWAEDVARAVEVDRCISLSTACSSGSDAILVGAELIRAGVVEYCICGGADVLTLSKRLAHSALSTMSPTRPRPFDVRHDGMLLGEGAGVLVLESEARARRRGAVPLALLRGVGSANDASSMTTPDMAARGARLAIQRSLEDAGLRAEEVGLINAHGSATQANDKAEKDAFRALFSQGPRPVVFATKCAFGHSLGATGALEAMSVVMALQRQEVPPIAGLEQPDPDFPLPLPVGAPVRCDARVGLSLTLGFGGFDTSLIFQACA
ncbi:MAG: beta-ketoacyl-[acyl-carrier-protein] synthase family protein [Myxococcaceae bacterium]|nr:beta-ketoacyl-[acyl-carrier-protein] synthase family protein [Myxococcaceae bacterium]